MWGWVKRKAKAAVDGIKKAVSAAIDACRKAVKAVIDKVKKLAMAVIEAARKIINAAIKAIGDALIAISNVLLAAFPALKARFQAAIRKAVDKATAAVNRLADAAKKAVQKALDMLGAALDKALQLLEKGINALIDAAVAVVQAAIKAAQAIVEALGTWARLIKDVATGPGAWIRNLGAAVVDGIKNHLWAAFKASVVEWFKSKVFELLGVGGIILELLLEGGLTREHIIQMALDALMVAIPAALIAILVEKLVSMIVPAAGAVMAIIEGLQAAWGTISRIVAAISAFVAFLLAVKNGSAAPLFAGMLAAAAVVVLDFVSNWLLKKLASAARKVGAQLKGLAEKFKKKRKAKKDAKAGKHRDDAKNHQPEAKKRDAKDKDRDEQQRRDQAEVGRVAKQAAARGWASVKAEAGRTVMSKAAAERVLASVEHAHDGIKVSLDVVTEGKTWSVKASATKTGHRATASAGRGPVLLSKSGGVYLASIDIRPVEKKVERMSRAELGKADEGRAPLDARLRKVEAEGQRMLDGRLKGLELSLTAVHAGGANGHPRVKSLIQPNYYEWEVEEMGGDWEDLRKEIDKRKGHRGRYNAELAFLQRLGEQFGAAVSYKSLTQSGEDFTAVVEVEFKKSGKHLAVWMHRLDTGPGKHEYQSSADPGECALSGKPLPTTTSGGTTTPDNSKRTRPHDALAGSVWRNIILDKGQATLGSTAPVLVFLNKVAAAAAHTNSYMVGDGRSSQQHEYRREGATTPNQSVEAVHHNTSAGERAQRATDPARTNPHNPDEMLVEISPNPTAPKAIIPKKDYRGDDWAGLSQDETNAALKARIQISIAGLKGVAQTNLPVAGLDETRLPMFWSAVELEAYQRGKWS